jgi:hypothetical protein
MSLLDNQLGNGGGLTMSWSDRPGGAAFDWNMPCTKLELNMRGGKAKMVDIEVHGSTVGRINETTYGTVFCAATLLVSPVETYMNSCSGVIKSQILAVLGKSPP